MADTGAAAESAVAGVKQDLLDKVTVVRVELLDVGRGGRLGEDNRSRRLGVEGLDRVLHLLREALIIEVIQAEFCVLIAEELGQKCGVALELVVEARVAIAVVHVVLEAEDLLRNASEAVLPVLRVEELELFLDDLLEEEGRHFGDRFELGGLDLLLLLGLEVS